MCNSLHSGAKPIPKSGFGYKVFTKREDDDDIEPMFGGAEKYKLNRQGWAVWKDKMYFDKSATMHNSGFCFFRTRKGAERMLEECKRFDRMGYEDCLVMKIRYRKGLGCNREGNIITGVYFVISICKEFKILD